MPNYLLLLLLPLALANPAPSLEAIRQLSLDIHSLQLDIMEQRIVLERELIRTDKGLGLEHADNRQVLRDLGLLRDGCFGRVKKIAEEIQKIPEKYSSPEEKKNAWNPYARPPF